MWKSSLNHGSHLCWTFPWYFVSKGPKNSLKWCVGGKNTKNSARIYTTQQKVFVRKMACQVSIVRTNVKHAPPKYFWRHPNSQEIQWKLWVSRWCSRYTFDYLYSCNLPKYFQIWKILKLTNNKLLISNPLDFNRFKNHQEQPTFFSLINSGYIFFTKTKRIGQLEKNFVNMMDLSK